MKLKCAIVDDEPLALDLLETYVRQTPYLEFSGRYSNAAQAQKGLTENPVDVLFCDIQMPETDGLTFVKCVPPTTCVVFTTAFSQYAVESYRVHAVDYLLKPISYEAFCESTDHILSLFEAKFSENDTLIVKSERKRICIRLENLLYVEAMRDYMKFVLDGDDMPVFSLMSLKSVMEQLPPDRFVRVHRSFIVQKSKIQVLENNAIVFGKVRVPISNMYKTDLLQMLGLSAK